MVRCVGRAQLRQQRAELRGEPGLGGAAGRRRGARAALPGQPSAQPRFELRRECGEPLGRIRRQWPQGHRLHSGRGRRRSREACQK
eukprot:scaffold113_cov96-Isochrysis_galbana.AAC.4